jgi:hypothetical protein
VAEAASTSATKTSRSDPPEGEPEAVAGRLFVVDDEEGRGGFTMRVPASSRTWGGPGSQMRKRVPRPTWLSTSMRPWWARTMRWTIMRPRPVPFFLVVWKGLKSWLMVSWGMPPPVSPTLNQRPSAWLAGGDGEVPPRVMACIGVADEVHEDLLDLVGVEPPGGRPGARSSHDEQSAVFQFGPQQFQGFADRGVEVGRRDVSGELGRRAWRNWLTM